MMQKIKFDSIRNLPMDMKVALYNHRSANDNNTSLNDYVSGERWNIIDISIKDDGHLVYLNDEELLKFLNNPLLINELKNSTFRITMMAAAVIDMNTYKVIKNRYGYNSDGLPNELFARNILNQNKTIDNYTQSVLSHARQKRQSVPVNAISQDEARELIKTLMKIYQD